MGAAVVVIIVVIICCIFGAVFCSPRLATCMVASPHNKWRERAQDPLFSSLLLFLEEEEKKKKTRRDVKVSGPGQDPQTRIQDPGPPISVPGQDPGSRTPYLSSWPGSRIQYRLTITKPPPPHPPACHPPAPPSWGRPLPVSGQFMPGMDTTPMTDIMFSIGVSAILAARRMAAPLASQRLAPRASRPSMLSLPAGAAAHGRSSWLAPKAPAGTPCLQGLHGSSSHGCLHFVTVVHV